MKYLKLGVISVILALFLSACASSPGKTAWYDQWGACAAGGAGLGIAAGAPDDFSKAMTGAAVGFAVGGAICALKDTDMDGVKNYKDDCPGTPDGGIVDDRGCEIDSDSDGVVDRLDSCPGTTEGARVDDRGCEIDSDSDGVPDSRDSCAGTPAGAEVNEQGCELDSDGDGVVNSKDSCPDTIQGVPVDDTGCELAAAYELDNVNFEFDSAKLTAGSTATLDEAVRILKRHSDLKVEIAGHTDSRGSEQYNQGLSERRAQSVADYLIAHGVSNHSITVKGYGESQPIADNGTEEGRAANRRVELRH